METILLGTPTTFLSWRATNLLGKVFGGCKTKDWARPIVVEDMKRRHNMPLWMKRLIFGILAHFGRRCLGFVVCYIVNRSTVGFRTGIRTGFYVLFCRTCQTENSSETSDPKLVYGIWY